MRFKVTWKEKTEIDYVDYIEADDLEDAERTVNGDDYLDYAYPDTLDSEIFTSKPKVMEVK